MYQETDSAARTENRKQFFFSSASEFVIVEVMSQKTCIKFLMPRCIQLLAVGFSCYSCTNFCQRLKIKEQEITPFLQHIHFQGVAVACM